MQVRIIEEDFDQDGENLLYLEQADHCACECCGTVGSLADEGDEGTVCRDCGGRGIMKVVSVNQPEKNHG